MSHRKQDHLIAVDIGNNRIKAIQLPACLDMQLPRSAPLLTLSIAQPSFADLQAWLPVDPATWWVASVNRPAEIDLARWIAATRPADRYGCLNNVQIPMENRVEFPEQVGTDRLLTALAASALRSSARPAIVIDAGSAITVDLVSADGAFEGGSILPGFEMMATALQRQTDQLPLVSEGNQDDLPEVIGRSTVAAIRSGLFWGHVGAVRELVQRIRMQTEDPPYVFVAGGDAARLAQFLEPAAQIVPNLVFEGILLTLRHLQQRSM